MLMKLRGQRIIFYLHEIYESQGNLYFIMEKLDHQLFDDYYHEEIQLIAQQLIMLLREFQKLNIVHHNLTQKHIMFDEKNIIKLISFGNTSSIKEQTDFFFDVYQTGEILLELYYINQDQLFSKSTYLPDHAVNFIIGLLNLTEYRLNINLEQTHPYFKSLNGESQLVKIRSLLPKRNLSDLKKNKKQQDTDQDQLTIQI
ncbi:unnamed protein product [Paramecium primaurelia]|uniref:Protein kinase domain-containing protein n=1 Tax=Paramecium primaurelia TaxID=5886 RepID=A0A8S1LX60_PARPR|nr:unnamed protein product [Paramecium primaurelia]